jgi:hypothetical protein
MRKTNPFARTALGWLRGRARSLEICLRSANLLRRIGNLTGRFIEVFHFSADQTLTPYR